MYHRAQALRTYTHVCLLARWSRLLAGVLVLYMRTIIISILLSYSNHLQTSIVHNNPNSMDFREQSFTWTAPSDDGFVNFMYVITNLTCFFQPKPVLSNVGHVCL